MIFVLYDISYRCVSCIILYYFIISGLAFGILNVYLSGASSPGDIAYAFITGFVQGFFPMYQHYNKSKGVWEALNTKVYPNLLDWAAGFFPAIADLLIGNDVLIPTAGAEEYGTELIFEITKDCNALGVCDDVKINDCD